MTVSDMTNLSVQPSPRRSRSTAANAIDLTVAVCGMIPYALVALILRLVMARDFFLSGQALVVGPTIPLSLHRFSTSLVLPARVHEETLSAFAAQFVGVPLSPTFIAYGFTTAEFLLPICLVIGFGTRIAAFILLIMTVVVQIYVDPSALWTLHVYWVSILLVLMACGGGAVSLDRLIWYLYQK